MRILTLNYEYPPLGGGAGVVSKKLDSLYAHAGHSVVTVTSGSLGNYGVSRTKDRVIYRLRCGRHNRGFSNTWEKIGYIIAALLKCGKIATDFQPHIIHCHFAVPTGLVAWYLHVRYSIPYIITSHGGDVPGFSPIETGKYFRLFNRLFARIWCRAENIVAMSKGLANLIKYAYGLEAVVIPNGINIDEYNGSGESNPDCINLLFAGRFTNQKNLTFLIRSLTRIRHKNWRLTLAGDGPDYSKLDQLIKAKRLESQVRLTGWQSSDQIRWLLRTSDILCLPSLNEGLPMIGLEALASGLAIVGTDTMGIRDIVWDGNNGFLVEPGNTGLFAKRLDQLLTHTDRLSDMKRASRKMVGNFEWQKIGNRYLNLLHHSARFCSLREAKTKKVLLLNLWPGGPDHYAGRLANILNKHYDCGVLCGELCDPGLYQRSVDRHIFPVAVPHSYHHLRQYGQLFKLSNYIGLLNKIKMLHYKDLLMVHFHPLLFPVFFTGKRVSYIYHDPFGHMGEHNIILHLLQRIALRFTHVVFVHSTRVIPASLPQSIKRKIEVIPHLDYSFLLDKGNARERTNREILFFGRFIPYKGIEYLIRAFAELEQEFPDWNLVIKGYGKTYFAKDIERISPNRLIVDNRFIPDDELADSLRRAGVVVLPYVDGSQSGVMAAAAAFAKPVITTAVNGLQDQLGAADSAIIVPPADVSALTNALRKVMNDSSLRNQLGQKLFKHYRNYSDQTNILNGMKSIFQTA